MAFKSVELDVVRETTGDFPRSSNTTDEGSAEAGAEKVRLSMFPVIVSFDTWKCP